LAEGATPREVNPGTGLLKQRTYTGVEAWRNFGADLMCQLAAFQQPDVWAEIQSLRDRGQISADLLKSTLQRFGCSDTIWDLACSCFDGLHENVRPPAAAIGLPGQFSVVVVTDSVGNYYHVTERYQEGTTWKGGNVRKGPIAQDLMSY